MIDMHTHVLPFVDDGSSSLEMSLNMLRIAIDDGITDIFLTPHYHARRKFIADDEEILKRFNSLLDIVKGLELKINLFLGREVYYTQEVLDILKNPTMNNSSYLLVEFSLRDTTDIDEAVYEIKLLGYKPIIAHPERYYYLDIKEIKRLHESGAYIQVNSSSIEGLFGSSIQKKAKALLKNRLVDFVSSDAHDDIIRSPKLSNSYRLVSKLCGKEYADEIFNLNARALLNEKV